VHCTIIITNHGQTTQTTPATSSITKSRPSQAKNSHDQALRYHTSLSHIHCTNHPHAVCLWLLLYTAHAHQFACLSTFKGPVFLFHGHTGMARLMNGLLHQLNGRYDSLRGYFVRFVHQFDGSMKG
jgi:hypothetical protein